MAEIDGTNGNGNHEGVVLDIKDNYPSSTSVKEDSILNFSVPFLQKMVAEIAGTYFLIFAGCSSVAVNLNFRQGRDTSRNINNLGVGRDGLGLLCRSYLRCPFQPCCHPCLCHLQEISMETGKTIVATLLKLGTLHITNLEASSPPRMRELYQKVPAYIACQVIGSTLAAGTIRLIFQGHQDQFTGTLPAGSNLQSFVVEFIITFYLMFIISGVATDNRAIGELAGLAVGSTVLLNVMFAGPISGASMNPARSLGPAIVSHQYKGLWIYIVSPILGAQAGAWVYNLIRYTDKPLREITKSASFLRNKERS
ncbi:hypothetical protein OIU84_014349 [Salix udensis]|uniref:Uncharacterized protein n=1 Tax=Salix udensis TaxID=889485 RepID=A0AAD6NQY4_9ROSI|nr:hypothetical protein OIU84_014349 [Salix udensis]